MPTLTGSIDVIWRIDTMQNLYGRFANQHAQQAVVPIWSIQSHIDYISRLNDYVSGKTREQPDIEANCRADCQIAKWMHGEGGKPCIDIDCCNSLCKNCEEFHENAAQAILLTSMGDAEAARDSMVLAKEASDRYLDCLILQQFHDL